MVVDPPLLTWRKGGRRCSFKLSRKLSLGGLSREVHGGAFPQKYYYYWGVIIKFPLSGLRTWRAGEEACICFGRAGIGASCGFWMIARRKFCLISSLLLSFAGTSAFGNVIIFRKIVFIRYWKAVFGSLIRRIIYTISTDMFSYKKKTSQIAWN